MVWRREEGGKLARAQKQSKNEKPRPTGEQKHLGNKPTSQRGREEEADGPPRKKSYKKQETPPDKEQKRTRARMGPAAPKNKCQHNNLCRSLATYTMNSITNQWALANPPSTSGNKPNLPPTGATKILVEIYQSSQITSNHPSASASDMT